MPAQITHIIAAEEALVLADRKSLGDLVEREPEAFRLGCQGPDIFYHNQRTKPSGLHYGALLHKRNYGIMLSVAVESARGRGSAMPSREHPGARIPDLGSAPVIAFLLGAATHAATDRILHPFIIHFSGRVEHGKKETERFAGCHTFLERLIDMEILFRYRQIGPESFGFSESMTLPERIRARTVEALAIVAGAGLRSAFPMASASDLHTELRIMNALDDARRFFAITDPARPENYGLSTARFSNLPESDRIRMAALLYPGKIPSEPDFMNRDRRQWTHPAGDGRSSDEDCFALFEKAVLESSRCMKAFDDYLEGRSEPIELETAIGNGCLGSCEADGRPSAGSATHPLPLDVLLRLHAEDLGHPAPASRD